MSAPEGWRRPAPRRAGPGAEIFPGDAVSAQEPREADGAVGSAGGADASTGGAGAPTGGTEMPAGDTGTPTGGVEASAGGRSARRGRRRGGGRLPDGPTPGSAAAQGPPADPEAVAREICLRQLSFSPKTRAQLADALRRKGVPDDVAERVLGRYSEVGLIDDAAFARAWVESRHAGRGLGRRALAAELRRRGVADEMVSEAVEEVGPEQEEAAARELVARRLPATRGLDPVKRTRRLMGMLARKGYSGGLAYRVVREALEAEGAEEIPDLSFDD
ncbi:recombination regulator RecX [Actinoallomurus purpureus]|uniref:recombination regulator RecX n=1 Tax=Actinoallomurus purpureus TaxID=478114 RepID=UPI00209269FA|nr:recombination regulator RecX [Actinoallomurus purpureus]MCO6006396.1 recombination regulator RecX [Actinoallomurus purpureus]